jgi:hypothetical protein
MPDQVHLIFTPRTITIEPAMSINGASRAASHLAARLHRPPIRSADDLRGRREYLHQNPARRTC